MFEYSIYSVISPEGCARRSCVRDSAKIGEAATQLRLTAPDLLEARHLRRDHPSRHPAAAHRGPALTASKAAPVAEDAPARAVRAAAGRGSSSAATRSSRKMGSWKPGLAARVGRDVRAVAHVGRDRGCLLGSSSSCAKRPHGTATFGYMQLASAALALLGVWANHGGPAAGGIAGAIGLGMGTCLLLVGPGRARARAAVRDGGAARHLEAAARHRRGAEPGRRRRRGEAAARRDERDPRRPDRPDDRRPERWRARARAARPRARSTSASRCCTSPRIAGKTRSRTPRRT